MEDVSKEWWSATLRRGTRRMTRGWPCPVAGSGVVRSMSEQVLCGTSSRFCGYAEREKRRAFPARIF